MTRDWSRPSRFARFGWWIPAVQLVCALANIVCLVWFDGGIGNWVALTFCASLAAFSTWQWRSEVAADQEHRTWMADFDRRWLTR